MSEAMSQAISIGLTGLAVVFAALSAIATVVAIIGHFDKKAAAGKAYVGATKTQPTIDDLSLVLITAAVTTVLQGRGRITRIRRMGNGNSGDRWSMKGRVTIQGSHVVRRRS